MIQATAMSVSPRNYIIFHPKGQQSNKPVETVRRISWSWTHGIKQLACQTRDDKAIPCSLSRSCSYHNETQLCCMFFLAALCGLWKKAMCAPFGPTLDEQQQGSFCYVRYFIERFVRCLDSRSVRALQVCFKRKKREKNSFWVKFNQVL